ncbi:MAG: hypothetical protein OSB21_12055, partial [Myxococcota bacterium]|nr:hypothetical protein [Myxococcota bacterium]
DFPLGTSCTTDEEGQCSTILRSERRAGPGQFEARVGRLPPQSIDILVNPDEAQAKVTVEIEGLGNYNWETGQRVDPLNNESTRLVLNKDQAQGTTFRVRLLDAFDNPLVGLPVTLTVLAEENQAISDAGPADAAATDSHALDAHTNLDATPNLDSGTDVGTDTGTDAGTNANTDTGTPTDLATPADAGNNKVLSLTPNSDSAMVALATAEGCPLSLPGGAQISADVQDDGYVRFCILPGQETTSFTLRIQPADLFRVGDASSMQLNGETRAGAPSAVVYVPSHEVENGQEIRLGCLPGGLSAVASFRVQNEQGSVPNVRVKFDAAGGLTGLTSALEVSDEQGLVQVQAICPANSLAGGRILADLAEVSDDVAASVAVQVRTDGIDQITIVEHGAWPPTLRSGVDILTLRFQAFNEANAPVLRAGLRPEDNAPDNRDPLAFTVTIASQGHARRVLLDAGNGEYTRPLVEHTILVDQDSGAADFSFKLQSPATYEHPLVLRVFEPGSQVSKTRSLHVTPGTPSQITVSPSGTVNAELMAGAGSFAFSVWDGDPAQGANRVPDVPISVAVPRSFVFLRGSSLALISGRTGNDGRFVVDVLQAQPMGEHELEGAIIVDDRTLAVGLTINVGAGEVVSALEMSLDGQVLPIITPEGGEALPTLTMRGGTRLDQTLRFRVVNRFGGGMPALGLAWTLQQGQQANCATFDEPGQTDERGEITFGPGALTVTAGGAVTDCVYRFAHGNTAAVQRLRVRQVPGLPNRATLSVTLRDAENDASAVRLRNSMDPPDEWSDETSRELILQAWDANNLAPAGLRMWLEVDNCFVEQRSAELDDLGRATFRVAGGVDAQTPCGLSARYFNERNEYTAPTL